MKSFKQYILEDNPALETSQSFSRDSIRSELPTDYANMYSLGSMMIDGNEYYFHGHSIPTRYSPYKSERFHSGFITTKTPEGNHSVVGNVDFYAHDTERNGYYANLPKLHKDHSGKGLMSELYKRLADHNKITLVSGRVHTKGGKNIWDELSQKGKVTAHNTDKPSSSPIVYDPNNPRHVMRFYKGGRSPSSNPTKWLFKYYGK